MAQNTFDFLGLQVMPMASYINEVTLSKSIVQVGLRVVSPSNVLQIAIVSIFLPADVSP